MPHKRGKGVPPLFPTVSIKVPTPVVVFHMKIQRQSNHTINLYRGEQQMT